MQSVRAATRAIPIVGSALALTACEACFSSGDDGAGKCQPTDALVIGLDDDTQKALMRVSRRGLMVVRADSDEENDCQLTLQPLPNCSAPGRYSFRPADGDKSYFVRRPDELADVLPLAGPKFRRALALFGGLKVQMVRGGRLVGPTKMLLSRRALRGNGCAEATHIVRTVSLGAYGVAAVEPARLDEVGDVFKFRPLAGQKTVRKQGRPEACARAAQTGTRNADCDFPIEVELVEVQSDGPARPEVSIAGGRFVRGMGSLDALAQPAHEVDLDAFLIDATEVSVAEYQRCVLAGRCGPAGKGRFCNAALRDRGRHPINCVSWYQAHDYCRFMDKRLPTEAEWERAALGAHRGPFPWGVAWPPPAGTVNIADSVAVKYHPQWQALRQYRDGFAETAPVGVLGKGEGIRDMAGNVMEWTSDFYGAYPRQPQLNPTGPVTGNARVVRGSSFGHAAQADLELTKRRAYRPDARSGHIGFRCVKRP